MLVLAAIAITWAATCADAVRAALVDLQAVYQSDPEAARSTRYVWSQHPSPAESRAVTLALNTAVSRASYPIRPAATFGGALYRLDLRQLAPRAEDLANLIGLWDRMARIDPHFYFRADRRQIKVAPYVHTDGKTYEYQWQDVFSFGGHVQLTDATLLMKLAGTGHPITRADHFCSMTTSTLDGGLYYEFAGIRKSDKDGQTDFERFLADHGVDRKAVERLRADRRAGILISGVTGKPRAVEYIQGPAGVVVWSEDIADANDDPKANPIRTLIRPRIDAIEVIAIKANGFCAFALYDGQGALQDVVPDNITHDHTATGRATSRLQPAISCIRCHAPEQGFRTAVNDVADIRKAAAEHGLRFDVLGQNGKVNDFDVLDRLAGLYRGDFVYLERGRDDYSTAVFRASASTVEEASTALGAIENEYIRGLVSPLTACRELGVVLPDKTTDAQAAAVLRRLLPPVPDERGLLLEDPFVGFLKFGRSITRADFREIYIDLATRAVATRIATEKTHERLPVPAPRPAAADAGHRAGG